jgi:hypothetical protein
MALARHSSSAGGARRTQAIEQFSLKLAERAVRHVVIDKKPGAVRSARKLRAHVMPDIGSPIPKRGLGFAVPEGTPRRGGAGASGGSLAEGRQDDLIFKGHSRTDG